MKANQRSLRELDDALAEASGLLAKAVAELPVAGDHRTRLVSLAAQLYATRFRLGDLRLAYHLTDTSGSTPTTSEGKRQPPPRTPRPTRRQPGEWRTNGEGTN